MQAIITQPCDPGVYVGMIRNLPVYVVTSAQAKTIPVGAMVDTYPVGRLGDENRTPVFRVFSTEDGPQ